MQFFLEGKPARRILDWRTCFLSGPGTYTILLLVHKVFLGSRDHVSWQVDLHELRSLLDLSFSPLLVLVPAINP